MRKFEISSGNRLYRYFWKLMYLTLFRFSPVFAFRFRGRLLNIFGATISPSARVYPSAEIYDPRNLVMSERSCIAGGVKVYNVDKVSLGEGVVVSQRVTLCTATQKGRWLDK